MLASLQAARAFAALSVAAFHLSIIMGLPRYGGNAAFGDYTAYIGGVRFFFVLSGFILLVAHARDIAPAASTLIGRLAEWKRFIWRRCIRIFPLYWLYTLVFAALVALGLGTDARIPTEPADWLTSLSLLRFTAAQPPLPVAWSLFHEVAFYLAFSILVVHRRAGIACFAIWSLACLVWFDMPEPDERSAFNVYTAAYNLYFVLGMLAWWLTRRRGNGVAETIGAVAILALATLLVRSQLPGFMLMMAGFALLLAGLAKLEITGRLRVPAWLVAIGNASYSMYLIHEQIQGLLLKIALRSGLYRLAGAHLTYLLVLAGTVVAGLVAYRLIERPLLRLLRRTETPRTAAVVVPEPG